MYGIPKADRLSYFLAGKASILIVTLSGSFIRESIPIMERCHKEVMVSAAKWTILNLLDVSPDMEKVAVPVFARLQKAVRAKPSTLRLSSVHPELRKFLEAQGLLRVEELANSLTEALKSLDRTG